MKFSIQSAASAAAATMLLGALLAGCGSSTDSGNTTTSGTTGTTGTTGGEPKTPEGGSTSSRKMPTAEGNKTTGDEILIGTVCSVSGDNKPWGEDSYEGSKMAVEEFNAAGGLGGKKVKLLLEDSASKQDQAKTAAEKLMADGALALIGEVSSGNTIQMAKSAFEKGVPVIAVGATRTDLTAEGAHVFRVCYTDDFQGPVMAKFAYEKMGCRKVAVMTDNNLPYSQGLSKSFMETFKKLGGEIVTEQFYESGGKQPPQYASLLTEIKQKTPDGMFLSGYFTEVGPAIQQARASGLDCPVFGGDGWDSDQLLQSGGDAVLGDKAFFCNHYNNADNRPQVTDFLKKWRAAHGGKDPGTTMAALGYDAMALTLDALKKGGDPSSKALMTAIENEENFPGVSGDITLKGMNGNPPKRAIVVMVTKKDASGNWQKFAKDYVPSDIK